MCGVASGQQVFCVSIGVVTSRPADWPARAQGGGAFAKGGPLWRTLQVPDGYHSLLLRPVMPALLAQQAAQGEDG